MKYVLTLILAAVLLVSQAEAQPQELRSIEAAARAGDWKKVEELSTSSLKRNPSDPSVSYILALAQLRLGKYERALASSRRLLTIDSLRIQPWLMISECEVALNRIPDAITTLSSAQARFPDSVQIPWALGMTLARAGRYDEAIAPLEEAMYRRPDVPSITDQLARCYHATRRFAESASLFQVVVEQSPTNAQAWLSYGEALLSLKKLDSAQHAFETAIKLRPDSATAYLALTAILTQQGHTVRALEVARKLTAQRPDDPQGWYNRGLLSLTAKRSDSAIQCFRTAIRLQPGYPEAYFNLSIAYDDQGFLEDAAIAMKRCAALSAKLAPDAYNSLAIIYRRQGRFDEAIATHAQAIALRDTASILYLSQLYTFFEAGRCDEAIPFIEQARTRFPTSIEVLFASARCWVRTGRKDDVHAAITVIEKTDPSLAEQLRIMMK